MTAPDSGGFRIRGLLGSVYVPALLFAIGEGAVAPVIVLMALDLGASPALAGAMVGLRGAGTMLMDVPAGMLVSRFGERTVMVVATLVLVGVAGVVGLGPPLPGYALLMVLTGGILAVWSLARLLLLMELVPVLHRGRAMSTMGGTDRIGIFMGAALGSATIGVAGLLGPFILQALAAATAALLLVVRRERLGGRSGAPRGPRLGSVLRDHRRTFATAGSAVAIMGIIRGARHAVIPLWGVHIGLDAATIAGIFAIAAALEIAAFYPVGLLMDRKGRKWAGLPFMVLVSVGLALVPLTDSYRGLLAVSILIAFANGLGSGIMMTLGSDLSPREGRSQFLGVWRLVCDAGASSGPLVVAIVTGLATLGAASLTVGAIGLAGAAFYTVAVPESRPRPDS